MEKLKIGQKIIIKDSLDPYYNETGKVESFFTDYTVFGKDVDINSLHIVDIYPNEYPQFESADISLGYFTDGEEMELMDIQEFMDNYPVRFHEIIIDSHY